MRDAGHRTPDAGHRTAKKAKIIYPPPRGVDIILQNYGIEACRFEIYFQYFTFSFNYLLTIKMLVVQCDHSISVKCSQYNNIPEPSTHP